MQAINDCTIGNEIKFMKVIISFLLLIGLISCNQQSQIDSRKKKSAKRLTTKVETVNGQKISLFEINFPGKLRAVVTNYGGIIKTLEVPDRNGTLEDIVLGFDKIDTYFEKTPYFGAILGRFSGRIAEGKFNLDGINYQLATNNGPNHLHGGTLGFDKKVWTTTTKETIDSVLLNFTYQSPDGEEGYPGNLTTKVTYTFTPQELRIDYSANTDKPTIVNLTQHTYFNLSACREDVLAHKMQLNANHFLPLDNKNVPTGIIEEVEETPFDFRTAKSIGKDINQVNEQLILGNGYDHSWVIAGESGLKPRFAGSLYHEKTGRQMNIYTTTPGMQIYTSNFLKGQFIGKNGLAYPTRYGVCFETQNFPNAPNQTNFPSAILRPDEIYHSTTLFQFLTK